MCLVGTTEIPPNYTAMSTPCVACNKPIRGGPAAIMTAKCRCENHYCLQHRAHDAHQCTFDYRGAGKTALVAAAAPWQPPRRNNMDRI